MNSRRRGALLLAGLLCSLAATQWVASQDAPAEEGRRSTAALPQPAGTARARDVIAEGAAVSEEVNVEKLTRVPSSVQGGDPFSAMTWEPPQPPVSARSAAPPPPPTAPPLPFSYFGKLTEDGRTTVFLIAENRSLAVRAGDVLDGRYRVENITESSVLLTYLPLNQQQTIAITN